MNPLDWIKGNLLYVVSGLLIASFIANAGLGLTLRSAWNKSGALEAVLEVQKGETKEAATANGTLRERITEILASKQALVDQMAQDKEQAERALFERDQRIQAMTASAIEERRKWNELINEEPGCEAFLRTPIRSYCSDLADRVRQRSRALTDYE